MLAQETAHCSRGIEQDAKQQVSSGADDARHPGCETQGAEKSEVIESDYPTDVVRTGGDVPLHVREQYVDGYTVGDFDGRNQANGQQDDHPMAFCEPGERLANVSSLFLLPRLGGRGDIPAKIAHAVPFPITGCRW